MATVAQHIAQLEKVYGKDRVFYDSIAGRWGFHTLGGTMSYAGKTRASAEKKMAKWDAEAAYWEAKNKRKGT